MRNGYILSGSKWHIQNISFWRLQIFCLCSLFCFEQNQDTFFFVSAGSKLCTILVILFRVLLVTKVNNLPWYCAAQSAKSNLEVLSRTRTKARFFLLFTVLFSTIPSISSSEIAEKERAFSDSSCALLLNAARICRRIRVPQQLWRTRCKLKKI